MFSLPNIYQKTITPNKKIMQVNIFDITHKAWYPAK